MGERGVRNAEVEGSNPLPSTNWNGEGRESPGPFVVYGEVSGKCGRSIPDEETGARRESRRAARVTG